MCRNTAEHTAAVYNQYFLFHYISLFKDYQGTKKPPSALDRERQDLRLLSKMRQSLSIYNTSAIAFIV